MNLLASSLYLLLLHLLHPFYVSMTDINYNNAGKELEISVRIFTDDFENTLRKHHAEKIDILHPADKAQMDAFVSDYIRKNLSVAIDGKPAALSYVGYERQEESIWTYFEITNVAAVKKINVTNSLLHDYNTNQVNIVHVQLNNHEESKKLDYPDSRVEFGW